MRKYLPGMSAFVIAIALSAFSAKKYQTTLWYIPAEDVSWIAITNSFNYSTSPANGQCADGNIIPCKLYVNQSGIQDFLLYLSTRFINDHATGEAYFLTLAGGYKVNP